MTFIFSNVNRLIYRLVLSLLAGIGLYLLADWIYSASLHNPRLAPSLISFFYACFFVPVIEELFFRYTLWTSLCRYTSIIGATIFSTLGFALFHMGRPVFSISIIAGIVFILLFYHFGNIIYPILAHIIYNCLIWNYASFFLILVLLVLFVSIIIVNISINTQGWKTSPLNQPESSLKGNIL